MPSAEITLPDGRRAVLEGPTREAVIEQARRLVSGAAPVSGSVPADPGTALADEALAAIPIGGAPSGRLVAESRAPLTLPFGLGEFGVSGPAAGAVRAASSVPGETSIPIAMATLGAAAAGPVMTGGAAARAAAPLLSRLPFIPRMALGTPVRAGLRFGPATAGAGAGGAAAGGLLAAEEPDATPASIAEAASRTGRQMAATELLGLGAGAALGAVAAPMTTSAMRGIAPLVERVKAGRERLAHWLSMAPAEARIAATELAEKFPDQAAAARAAAERLRELTQLTARRNGERVVRPEALQEAWEALTPEARAALGSINRFRDGVLRVAKFANSEVGRELLESAAVPIAASAFGPAGAAVVWGVRNLVAPGPLARWFQRSTLPDPLIRTAGRELVLVPAARAGLLDEER